LGQNTQERKVLDSKVRFKIKRGCFLPAKKKRVLEGKCAQKPSTSGGSRRTIKTGERLELTEAAGGQKIQTVSLPCAGITTQPKLENCKGEGKKGRGQAGKEKKIKQKERYRKARSVFSSCPRWKRQNDISINWEE